MEKGEILMYTAYVTKLKNIRNHPNADRLNLAECFGNTVVVSKDYDAETLYLYFPTDGQLSEEYATINNLVRKKDDAGNNIGGYLDPDKRNIRAIKLRGEKSDGLVMPLESVAYTGANISEFQEGIVIHMLNGHEICCKYVPRCNPGRYSGNGNRTRKKRVPVAPLFAEHADTEQLAYNLSAFRPGDQIEITLKMHGTSQRTGYLPTLKRYKKNLLDYILRREGTPIYDWGYVTGTRRTVLENYEGGYYGDNEFREQHSKVFEGKLHKGETVYYEVCAFTTNGTPIMSSGKVPKEAQSQYGETMVFSYGCEPTGKKVLYGRDEIGVFSIEEEAPQSAMYVYRMTLTTEEGYTIDYTPDYMRYRCEQMGVNAVPVFWTGHIPEHPGSKDDDTITAGEWVKNKAEQYYDGPDPIGKTHVREGVVVRIVNRPKFCAYKHKNFLFKQISGIISDKIADSNEVISEDILSEM
jgi:hypothetical protein